MDATYGGTTQASDWGEHDPKREELSVRLHAILEIAKTLPHDNLSIAIRLGVSDEAVGFLLDRGAERRTTVFGRAWQHRLGGREAAHAIDSAELVIGCVTVNAQRDSRALTDDERAEDEARSKA